MSSTTETTESMTLNLRTAYGPKPYNVSTAPARECTEEEIPIIELSGIDGDLDARKALAEKIRKASESNGFFYIKNHGIDKKLIQNAYTAAVEFFAQPSEKKELVSKDGSKHLNNGWSAPRSAHVCPDESLDLKEGFGWSYTPLNDPLYADRAFTPSELEKYSQDEPRLWEGTAHLPNFKTDSLAYWRACLSLSRKLIRTFALSLSLPEDYFDAVTTFPGADGVYNRYPALTPDQLAAPYRDVGLGSHTDLQCFTLLWQDMAGGLQILNLKNEWIWAKPIEGTIVVNIGDFLGRLTNDRYRSTVHRAYNRGLVNKDRISMPFFFGFNYDEKCAVLPSCVDADHPAKYEPISCGEWRRLRFQQANRNTRKNGSQPTLSTY